MAIGQAKSVAADIAIILIATGARPNELFSAATENCKETYFISGSKTEAGKNRVIPISTIGLPAYRRLSSKVREKGSPLLIEGYDGNRQYRNFAKRDWKTLMEEVGIENMSTYNCRHTYTTLAVKSGVKPEILQKILGHADYSTTVGVYTHLDIDEILQESTKVTVTDTLQTNEKCVRQIGPKSSGNK